MASPPRTPAPGTALNTPANGNGNTEEGRRVESIKQYYQQLCANYRHVSQQLQHPELPSARRPILQGQLEKLQAALQEFTDKVIKPIIIANRASPRPAGPPPLNTMGSLGNMSSGSGDNVRMTTVSPSSTSVASSMMGTPVAATTKTTTTATTTTTTNTPAMTQRHAPASKLGRPSNPLLVNSSNAFSLGLTPSFYSEGQPTAALNVTTTTTTRPSTAAFTSSMANETRLREAVWLEPAETSSTRKATRQSVENKMDLADLLAKIPTARPLEKCQVTGDAERLLYALADRYLAAVGQGVCESARHRKRPGISTRDLELVMGREMGMGVSVAGIPFAVPPPPPAKIPPKKALSTNPHHVRMQQLKKHLASLQSANTKL